jgi:two-component sensor histidine kinase
METGNFLMPLSEFERRAEMYHHRRLIHPLALLAPARDRLIATGARVVLPIQMITMLSLILYELGTNSLKYGAVASARR